MILFKQEHVPLILSGAKTQTRRTGSLRWKVGALHQCRTRMLDVDSTFAVVRILGVGKEMLMDISEDDARAEGYDSAPDFLAAFVRINKMPVAQDVGVWVVEFELMMEAMQ